MVAKFLDLDFVCSLITAELMMQRHCRGKTPTLLSGFFLLPLTWVSQLPIRLSVVPIVHTLILLLTVIPCCAQAAAMLGGFPRSGLQQQWHVCLAMSSVGAYMSWPWSWHPRLFVACATIGTLCTCALPAWRSQLWICIPGLLCARERFLLHFGT